MVVIKGGEGDEGFGLGYSSQIKRHNKLVHG